MRTVALLVFCGVVAMGAEPAWAQDAPSAGGRATARDKAHGKSPRQRRHDAVAKRHAAAVARRDRRRRPGSLNPTVTAVAAIGVVTFFALDPASAQGGVEPGPRPGWRWSGDDEPADVDVRDRRRSSLGPELAIGGRSTLSTGVVLDVHGHPRDPNDREPGLWVAPRRTAVVVGPSWRF